MMSTKCRAVVVGLLAAASVSCDDDTFTTPTGVTIVIYQDSNYRGDNRALGSNEADLDNLPGCGGSGADWDDCISSIRIPSGWELTVFQHDNYEGARMTFTADVSDLEQQSGPCGNDWDDCISSVQVRQR